MASKGQSSKGKGVGAGPRKGLTPRELESLLRHWEQWRALYEDEGIDEITMPNGYRVSIHDLFQGIDELPPRQRMALILTTIRGLREVEAAPLMGFHKWTSPVSSYKAIALRKLCERYWSGDEDDEGEGE